MKSKKKTIKNKSFYFEDYKESEILDDNKSHHIKISLNRVAFLFFIFISLLLVFSIKITYLSLSSGKNFYSNSQKNNVPNDRNIIVDRNGTILAANVTLYDIGVRPKLLNEKEKKNLLIKLRILFPKLDIKKIKKKLKNEKYFTIGKRLTPKQKDQFWLMGNKAFVYNKKPSRLYPHKNLFSHILGQTDDLNEGISGLEKSLNSYLSNNKKVKSDLNLTLDTNIQHIIREELINAQSDFENVGSAAVLMDIHNGEILSLISMPDYDLNKRVIIEDKAYTNKITLGVYELGSVFKTFTIAAGLENNIIQPNTIFKNLENELTCDKYSISEHDKLPKNLSVEQILVRSSNIGSVRIAQKIGIAKYNNFLKKLGLLNKVNFDLEEVGTPIPFKWGKCKLATVSYGHGITTTPLQLATAYAILGNGGYKIKPSILKNNLNINKTKKKIISTKTSNEINSMLRKVVSLSEGTANFANVEGYEVAGKTGTALKYNSKEKLNTFVSLFPASNPRYVLLVILDEPKSAPSYIYKMPPSEKFPNGYDYKGETRNTSGWNTVVTTGKIIEKIGPILAINNLQAAKKF